MPKERKQFGVLVTKDFQKTDVEFQKLCEKAMMDQSKVIRELIKSWVKNNRRVVNNLIYKESVVSLGSLS